MVTLLLPSDTLSFPFIYLYYFIPNYFTTLSIHAHFVTFSLPLCYPFNSPLLRLRLPTHHFITPPLSISSHFAPLSQPFCSPFAPPFITPSLPYLATSSPLHHPFPVPPLSIHLLRPPPSRRDWRAAKAAALSRAAEFEPRAPVITAPPALAARDWQSDRDAGLAVAAAAMSSARDAAAGFRAEFGNGNVQRDDANGDNMMGPDTYAGVWPNGQPAAADNNNNNNNWQDVASSWQQYGSSVAASASSQYAGQGASWELYGSSIAASASSQYQGNGDWQQTAESAKSMASSYRSEYGAPEMTPAPTMAQPTMSKGSMGTTVRGGYAKPTQEVVQVNGAEGAGKGAANVLCAGVAVLAIAAGMI